MCWWWRKVRRAEIPNDARDAFFEELGQFLVANRIADNQPPRSGALGDKYNDVALKQYGTQWIRELADRHERRENRLETVEWAILIFVVVGVAADCLIVAHELGWLLPLKAN